MSSNSNSIAGVTPFTQHASFTLWRLEPHPTKPDAKPIKVPVHYDGKTHHSLGRKATRTLPARPPNPAPPLDATQAQQWLTYNRSIGVGHDRTSEVGYLGLGFRPAGTGLACLDIDDCIAGGVWSDLAIAMMQKFPGALLEVSTSGRGLHIWFTVTQPLGRYGKDRSGQLELYSEGQFIAAGRVLQGDAHVDHTAAALDVLAQYWPPRPPQRTVTEDNWDEKTDAERADVLVDLQHALSFIQADDRDVWIGVGQALACLGDVGFDLWDEWSRTSDAYKGREDLERANVTGDRTGYQSIFARAALADGYLNPKSKEARIATAMSGFGQGPVPGSVAPPAAATVEPTTMSFMAAAEGLIASSLPNVVDALGGLEMSIKIGFDEFLARPMIGDCTNWRPIDDADAATLRCEMERRGFKAVSPEIMKSALTLLSRRNRFDSAINWANGLQHDGQARVTMALHRYYGVPDNPYTRACSEYLFTALAGRCLSPGCQADMALILVGVQGARKTSAVMALAPYEEAFVKINLGKRDEDLSRRLRGKLVAELPELRGLTGRDIQGIRDWVTNRNESWVEKYQAYETTFKRRFIGIGTANEDEVLDDPEGERRWLPMKTGMLDLEGLQRDRDQLWAEGVAMWRAGGIRWQAAEHLARDEHRHFKVVDEWSEMVHAWLNGMPSWQQGDAVETGRQRGSDPFTVAQILTGALKFLPRDIKDENKKRVVKILKAAGYVSKPVYVNSETVRRWVKASA